MPSDETQSGNAATTWEVVHPETGKVVAEYDSEAEAKDAADWYANTWRRILGVRRADA